MTPLIIIQNLSVRYNQNWIFNNFFTTIYRDNRVALVGANGSGKTTFLKTVARLIPTPKKRIIFFGKTIAYVSEQAILPQFLTAYDLLWYKAHIALSDTKQIKNSIHELLDLMYLLHVKYKKVGTFSKGMKQRMLLAQALICKPDLLLLDEPFSGLDEQSCIIVETLLKTPPCTIIYSMHEQPIIADQIIFFPSPATI